MEYFDFHFPWYVASVAIILSLVNAAYCAWRILRVANGYMVLFETEDDETTSKGGLYRKWHLLTLFLYCFLRIIVHSVDPMLVVEIGAYNSSVAESALYVLPPVFFIIYSTYLIFYLSYLCSELKESSQRSSFSWRWLQCSGVYIVVCLCIVLLQLPPFYLYSLLAASCSLVVLAILYCYAQLYSALSSRITTAVRRVTIRLSLLVLVSLAALSFCIFSYAQAAYLDHSHRLSPSDWSLFCIALTLCELCSCSLSLLLLVNDCLSFETLILTVLRKLSRSNSLYEGRGENGALHVGAARAARGGYQSIAETPPQV